MMKKYNYSGLIRKTLTAIITVCSIEQKSANGPGLFSALSRFRGSPGRNNKRREVVKVLQN
jgi:hypothetical protein